MDSYVNLLSPLDNFNFNHFASPAANHPESNAQYNSLISNSPQAQHIDSMQKTDNELLHLLEGGPKMDEYAAYNLWDPASYQPSPGTPWRPHIVRSYSDSPLSTSSALSSVPNSNTCSPWETLPALAPSSSPDFMIPEGLAMDQQYPSLLDFTGATTDDASANAFNGLSLASPLLLPQQQPIHPCQPGIPGMSGGMEMEMDGTFSLAPSTLSTKSSALSLASSAASYSMHASQANDSYNAQADQTFTLNNHSATPHQSSAGIPALTYRSASPAASDPGDMATHRLTPHSHAQHYHFLTTSPSMPSLHSRTARRKASRVISSYKEFPMDDESDDDYNDADADGDFEYEDEDGDAPRGRSSKRMRHSPGVGSASDGSVTSGGSRRAVSGMSLGMGGRKASSMRKASESSRARKSKNKKRHHCSHADCNSSFTRITDMERHLTSVHRAADSTANRCAFCRKQFSREDAVLRHENDSCPMRPKKGKNALEKWI